MKVERRSTARMNGHRGGNHSVEDQAGAFGHTHIRRHHE